MELARFGDGLNQSKENEKSGMSYRNVGDFVEKVQEGKVFC